MSDSCPAAGISCQFLRLDLSFIGIFFRAARESCTSREDPPLTAPAFVWENNGWTGAESVGYWLLSLGPRKPFMVNGQEPRTVNPRLRVSSHKKKTNMNGWKGINRFTGCIILVSPARWKDPEHLSFFLCDGSGNSLAPVPWEQNLKCLDN